jgi:hypothetical protein
METAKTFDPWFATKAEAIAEDERRAVEQRAIIAERRRHPEGSARWQELRQQIGYCRFSAVEQVERARYVSQFRDTAHSLPELQLLSLVVIVSTAGLIMPCWLSIPLSQRLAPIQAGEKAGFEHWRTGSRFTTRKYSDAISLRVFELVTQLRASPAGRKKYPLARESRLWSEVTAAILKQFDIAGFSTESAYKAYSKGRKRFEAAGMCK